MKLWWKKKFEICMGFWKKHGKNFRFSTFVGRFLLNNFVNTGHKHMKFSPCIDIVEIHIVLKFHCSISFLKKVILINVLKHRTQKWKITRFIPKTSNAYNFATEGRRDFLLTAFDSSECPLQPIRNQTYISYISYIIFILSVVTFPGVTLRRSRKVALPGM